MLADPGAVKTEPRRAQGSILGEIADYFRRLTHLILLSANLGPRARTVHGRRRLLFLCFLDTELPERRARLRSRGDRLGRRHSVRLRGCGRAIGRLDRRRPSRGGLSVDASRKLMIWTGALLVPLALPAVYVDSPVLAVLFMGLGIFAIQVKSASVFALPTRSLPVERGRHGLGRQRRGGQPGGGFLAARDRLDDRSLFIRAGVHRGFADAHRLGHDGDAPIRRIEPVVPQTKFRAVSTRA